MLLSPRYLTFANHYVSMKCRTEVLHDLVSTNSADTGLEVRHDDSYFREDGSGIDLNRSEWDFKQFGALVFVFSGLDITDERDRHNACQGSLNRITEKTGCRFYHGLPYNSFLEALLWKPHHQHILQRRQGFPSWSWLGSQGRVEYPYWINNHFADGPQDEPSSRDQRMLARGGMTAESRFVNEHLKVDKARVFQNESSYESPGLEVQSTICTFSLRRIYGERSLTQGSGVTPGDYWALLDEEGRTIINKLGEDQKFRSTEVSFRLASDYSDLLTNQHGKADFVFVKYWSLIWDSDQASSTKDVIAETQLRDYVSALLVSRLNQNANGTYSYQRLASIAVPKDVWLAQGPEEVEIVLV